MRRPRLLLSIVLATLGVLACAGAPWTSGVGGQSATPTTQATQGTVTQSDSGCTITGLSPSISAGYITLTAVNKTTAVAGFDMWRISEPNTYQDLAAFVEKDNRLAADGQPGLGPPPFGTDLVSAQILPSKTGTLYGAVRRGTYGIVCLGQTPAGSRPTGVIGPVQVQ